MKLSSLSLWVFPWQLSLITTNNKFSMIFNKLLNKTFVCNRSSSNYHPTPKLSKWHNIWTSVPKLKVISTQHIIFMQLDFLRVCCQHCRVKPNIVGIQLIVLFIFRKLELLIMFRHHFSRLCPLKQLTGIEWITTY